MDRRNLQNPYLRVDSMRTTRDDRNLNSKSSASSIRQILGSTFFLFFLLDQRNGKGYNVAVKYLHSGSVTYRLCSESRHLLCSLSELDRWNNTPHPVLTFEICYSPALSGFFCVLDRQPKWKLTDENIAVLKPLPPRRLTFATQKKRARNDKITQRFARRNPASCDTNRIFLHVHLSKV
ncbi:uncharacterized protein BCR38DRAFT_53212 [Pseudomassariella vexata]|uniref:Uncharacterized protein n=1 Tax=Pseudomassariella vexata TaxID=1141098 RepID=A0A1Y2DL89_9PEZI|nr:uncharacterized protein BCR38DRAFT_53212 [Pseudomassariella vexata]ORY60078.1 hypothetical protein BCR38DRAFT_53212 [Pseudomassariella vexata]